MMSGEAIREVSKQAAAKARRAKKVPFTVEMEDLQDWKQCVASGNLPLLPFPFLGPYAPRGWQQTNTLFFVDSSGWGGQGESALTIPQFIEKLEVGKSYAIIEAGQFQIYIAEFEEAH